MKTKEAGVCGGGVGGKGGGDYTMVDMIVTNNSKSSVPIMIQNRGGFGGEEKRTPFHYKKFLKLEIIHIETLNASCC